ALADLEHQSGFADARRTAHQHQGALYRSSAQHPVQLSHAGGEPDFLPSLSVIQVDRLYSMEGRTPPLLAPAGPCFWRGLLLYNGVPLAAGGTAARPLRRLVAAGGTEKNAFWFCHV